ncbi:hypothetical protein TNIN_227551 [Trichonephila inaurata madagascariensis]|uniref:Uncharacterized protein n=1 Tax=Trichonephila inaurata madagascariensis TaxID=2747483 RepID=A0A8X7BPU1_9ARAC|nr:hypothetical protein TNIN_227551 [Trichonephila inaurata madagascariensis]
MVPRTGCDTGFQGPTRSYWHIRTRCSAVKPGELHLGKKLAPGRLRLCEDEDGDKGTEQGAIFSTPQLYYHRTTNNSSNGTNLE